MTGTKRSLNGVSKLTLHETHTSRDINDQKSTDFMCSYRAHAPLRQFRAQESQWDSPSVVEELRTTAPAFSIFADTPYRRGVGQFQQRLAVTVSLANELAA